MRLSDSQRQILEFIELADGEGSALAHDVAAQFGFSPRSMGGRLAGLEQCGLVSRVLVKPRASYRSDPLWGWCLTKQGREAVR